MDLLLCFLSQVSFSILFFEEENNRKSPLLHWLWNISLTLNCYVDSTLWSWLNYYEMCVSTKNINSSKTKTYVLEIERKNILLTTTRGPIRNNSSSKFPYSKIGTYFIHLLSDRLFWLLPRSKNTVNVFFFFEIESIQQKHIFLN